ncbi:hypothetical protein VNI00_000154 [Paramarasmius palmivorus]|uniref:Repressor of RNA polymerase III transcription MAF1 n=1 Tax=Paramarasmius palmivorus TaxID=297713 RepID=A0AAW0EC31_9AGAR
MKYIENPALSNLAQSLSHQGPECSVHVRMEAYSCKNIKRDKKLFKALEEAYTNEHSSQSGSPPLSSSWLEPEMTPFGPFDNHSSRKTLYLLISTLNCAFPDHEFSDVRPAHFNREESGASVLNALSTTLVAPHRAGMNAPRTYGSYPSISPDLFPIAGSNMMSMSPLALNAGRDLPRSPFSPPPIMSGTHPNVYRLVDDVIGLEECESEISIRTMKRSLGNGDDDDEYERAGVGRNGGGWWDENVTFEFDDYDVDESPRSSLSSSLPHTRKPRGERPITNSASSSVTNSPNSPTTSPASLPPRMRQRVARHSMPGAGTKRTNPPRDNSMANALTTPISMKYSQRPGLSRRRTGALLWSSHWFFLNRKQKRILFVSVWARSRPVGRAWDEEEYEDELYADFGSQPSFTFDQVDSDDEEFEILDDDAPYTVERATPSGEN